MEAAVDRITGIGPHLAAVVVEYTMFSFVVVVHEKHEGSMADVSTSGNIMWAVTKTGLLLKWKDFKLTETAMYPISVNDMVAEGEHSVVVSTLSNVMRIGHGKMKEVTRPPPTSRLALDGKNIIYPASSGISIRGGGIRRKFRKSIDTLVNDAGEAVLHLCKDPRLIDFPGDIIDFAVLPKWFFLVQGHVGRCRVIRVSRDTGARNHMEMWGVSWIIPHADGAAIGTRNGEVVVWGDEITRINAAVREDRWNIVKYMVSLSPRQIAFYAVGENCIYVVGDTIRKKTGPLCFVHGGIQRQSGRGHSTRRDLCICLIFMRL